MMEPKFRVGQQIRVVETTPLLGAGQQGRIADIRRPRDGSPPVYMFHTPDGKRHWLEEGGLAEGGLAADDGREGDGEAEPGSH